MNKAVTIFPTPYDLAKNLAEELINCIVEAKKKEQAITIALSGGSTPELLYSIMGDHYSNSAPWDHVHFFWGDERCVAADHPDSNYGMARKKFLDKIDIPLSNIHRIRGEDDPEEEEGRYSREIISNTRSRDGLPAFDMILLGLGEDGHTASIFPGNMDLLSSDKICEVTVRPDSSQKRITLTGRVINNSELVTFLITGHKKAEIVEKVLKGNPAEGIYPASYVIPEHGELRWLIDNEAAGLL